MKHTPGPWTVINGNKFFPTVVMANVEVPKEDIGTLNYPKPHFVVNMSHNQQMESIMANAKLIAAAPALLDTLKKALYFLEALEDHGVINKNLIEEVSAVIVKATE